MGWGQDAPGTAEGAQHCLLLNFVWGMGAVAGAALLRYQNQYGTFLLIFNGRGTHSRQSSCVYVCVRV